MEVSGGAEGVPEKPKFGLLATIKTIFEGQVLGEKERLLYSGSQKSDKTAISKVPDQADEF